MPQRSTFDLEHDQEPLVHASRHLVHEVGTAACSPSCAGMVLAMALDTLCEEWGLPPSEELVAMARVVRKSCMPLGGRL
jgi:hypothetical protein